MGSISVRVLMVTILIFHSAPLDWMTQGWASLGNPAWNGFRQWVMKLCANSITSATLLIPLVIGVIAVAAATLNMPYLRFGHRPPINRLICLAPFERESWRQVKLNASPWWEGPGHSNDMFSRRNADGGFLRAKGDNWRLPRELKCCEIDKFKLCNSWTFFCIDWSRNVIGTYFNKINKAQSLSHSMLDGRMFGHHFFGHCKRCC